MSNFSSGSHVFRKSIQQADNYCKLVITVEEPASCLDPAQTCQGLFCINDHLDGYVIPKLELQLALVSRAAVQERSINTLLTRSNKFIYLKCIYFF